MEESELRKRGHFRDCHVRGKGRSFAEKGQIGGENVRERYSSWGKAIREKRILIGRDKGLAPFIKKKV